MYTETVLIAAGFLFASVLSQTPSQTCSTTGTTTVYTNEQITALAECVTYSGDIHVMRSNPSGTPGTSTQSSSKPLETIDLTGLEKVDGNIQIYDPPGLKTISGSDLKEVKAIVMESDTLTRISLQSLEYTEFFQIYKAPLLAFVEFGTGLNISELRISGQYNTPSLRFRVATLNWLWFGASGITQFIMEMDQVKLITLNDSFYQDTSTVSFPDLTTVDGFNCSYGSNVSAPQLESIPGMLNIQESQMEINFPNLTRVGGDLIISNSRIEKLDFPVLERVGSLKVTNNTGVRAFTSDAGLPSLRNVDNLINITGEFDEIYMSNLTSAGTVSVLSTSKSMDCTTFDRLNASQQIKESYTCNGTHNNNNSDRPKETPEPKPGLSAGAKAGLGVGVAIAVLALLLAAAFYLMRRRKKAKSTTPPPEEKGYEKPEIDGVEKPRGEMDGAARAEVGGDARVSKFVEEMPNGTEAQELPGTIPNGKNATQELPGTIPNGKNAAQELPGEHGLSEVEGNDKKAVHVVKGTHELAS